MRRRACKIIPTRQTVTIDLSRKKIRMGPIKTGKLQRISDHRPFEITEISPRIQESTGNPAALLLKFANPECRVPAIGRTKYCRPTTRYTGPAGSSACPTRRPNTTTRKTKTLPIERLKRNRLVSIY